MKITKHFKSTLLMAITLLAIISCQDDVVVYDEVVYSDSFIVDAYYPFVPYIDYDPEIYTYYTTYYKCILDVPVSTLSPCCLTYAEECILIYRKGDKTLKLKLENFYDNLKKTSKNRIKENKVEKAKDSKEVKERKPIDLSKATLGEVLKAELNELKGKLEEVYGGTPLSLMRNDEHKKVYSKEWILRQLKIAKILELEALIKQKKEAKKVEKKEEAKTEVKKEDKKEEKK